MSRRTEMIGSTLQQELMQIIMRQLNDPRLEGMPSITRVKVATDLSTADVFVTIMGTEGKQSAALNALKSSAGVMREKLRKTLPMRTIPFLKFHIDEALKKELTVLELIDKAVKEENELHPQPAADRVAAADDSTAEVPNEEREQAHENLKSLLKKLTRDGKPEARQAIDPLRALVLGVLSFDAPAGRADGAMEIIDREFVDLNELRVATELEVIEIIGPKYPGIERRAMMFRDILNAIFEKEHTLSFERYKTLNKKDARAALRELPDMTPYVEAYTLLFGMDAAAAPVDHAMLEVLAEAGAVEPDTTVEDAQKFVEGHLKAEELYEFYALVSRAAAARKVKV